MTGLLPDKINWRKDKQGFVSPQEEWLRYDLHDDILKIFNPDALIFKLGIINRDRLLDKYDSFVKGSKGVWYRDIFAPLALETWLQLNQDYIQA